MDTYFSQLDQSVSGFNTDKPLIVCDVDEVICPSAAQFQAWLRQQGWRYQMTTPWIQTWIIHDQSGRQFSETEIDTHLPAWFAQIVVRQGVYAEAPAALTQWQARCNVLILTNLWLSQAQSRRDSLSAAGIGSPICFWTGDKAPALARLSQQFSNIAFIDDHHQHVENVRQKIPTIEVNHFIANPEIRAISKSTSAARSSNSWAQLNDHMHSWLQTLNH